MVKAKVSAPTISIADPKIFDALQQEMENLFNSTQWTEDTFDDHEKISGSIQLTIKEELSATAFKAELIVQLSRPVYNSQYSSQTMFYKERAQDLCRIGIERLHAARVESRCPKVVHTTAVR